MRGVTIAALAVWIIAMIIGANLLATGIRNEQRLAVFAGGRGSGRDGPGAGGSGPGGPRDSGRAHPLLEFCHPALAVVGLTFWIFFVVTRRPIFAWIGFAAMAVTVLAGLTWLISGLKARRGARAPRGPYFPGNLVLLHGLAVACTFGLVLAASILAGQG